MSLEQATWSLHVGSLPPWGSRARFVGLQLREKRQWIRQVRAEAVDIGRTELVAAVRSAWEETALQDNKLFTTSEKERPDSVTPSATVARKAVGIASDPLYPML